MKIDKFANNIDPEEMAHNKPPHLDLHYLPSSLSILNNYGLAWMIFFVEILLINSVAYFWKFLHMIILLSAFC